MRFKVDRSTEWHELRASYDPNRLPLRSGCLTGLRAAWSDAGRMPWRWITEVAGALATGGVLEVDSSLQTPASSLQPPDSLVAGLAREAGLELDHQLRAGCHRFTKHQSSYITACRIQSPESGLLTFASVLRELDAPRNLVRRAMQRARVYPAAMMTGPADHPWLGKRRVRLWRREDVERIRRVLSDLTIRETTVTLRALEVWQWSWRLVEHRTQKRAGRWRLVIPHGRLQTRDGRLIRLSSQFTEQEKTLIQLAPELWRLCVRLADAVDALEYRHRLPVEAREKLDRSADRRLRDLIQRVRQHQGLAAREPEPTWYAQAPPEPLGQVQARTKRMSPESGV